MTYYREEFLPQKLISYNIDYNNTHIILTTITLISHNTDNNNTHIILKTITLISYIDNNNTHII